jgi:hypothetical protein
MIFDICLAELNRIRKTSINMTNISKSIQYKKVVLLEEKENIKKLHQKVINNYRSDLQCKTLSYKTEIMAIENELLLQSCIRIQRRVRAYSGRDDLVSLDEIKGYRKYMIHLKEELINTRLELLLYSDDLLSFKNDYLTNHIQYINVTLLKTEKSIIMLQKREKNLNRVIDSSYKLICEFAGKGKMTICDVMKIQGQIKKLTGFPRYKELLNDFTVNITISQSGIPLWALYEVNKK